MAAVPDPPVIEPQAGQGDLAPGLPLDDFVPYLLNRIVNRLNARLAEDLKQIGVPIGHYRVLAVLVAGEGRTVNELSVYTVIELSTLSKLLDRMAAAGLIERRSDAADGRIVNIHITELGRATYQKVLPIALEHYRHALQGIGADEHRALLASLHRILDNVRVSPFP